MLDLQRLAEIGCIALVDDRLVEAQRVRRDRGHVLREFHRRRHQFVRRDDAIDEAPFQRRRRIEEIAGQRQFLGAVDADDARQFCDRPQPGMMPTRACVSAKRALVDAISTSQASASSKPPLSRRH